MPKIHLLDDALINKIAAGEVVERPASAVKELMENSLDAEAETITIEVEEGGKSGLKVIDDGCGMEKEDALLCLERHATSKISTTEDLFQIQTLGFRGEALASIAAVSELVLKTKTKENETGCKLLAHAGKILESHECALPQGTSIEVTDLFFNVPARKKHLKTIQTELRQITEVVTKYALAYPEKSFTLLHQKQEILFAPATKNPLDRILTLYGKKIAYGMLPVQSSCGGISVNGFLSKPTLTRGDKTIQHIFVNKRAVRNHIITKAVYDAYHTLLHLENHPLFLLHVFIPPNTIDVNVHPQKAVIRVEKENELYTAIYTAVRETLDTAKCIPLIAEEKNTAVQAHLIAQPFAVTYEAQTFFKKEESSVKKSSMQDSVQDSLQDSRRELSAQELLESALEKVSGNSASVQEPFSIPRLTAKEIPALRGNERISSLNLIGRVHNLFYLAENEKGLVIIDQHAAHERVLYEKFMQHYLSGTLRIQELLVPEEIEFSPSEMLLLQENKEGLEKVGFVLEEFGRNTMLLRSVPFILEKIITKDLLHEVLSRLGERTTALDERKEEKIIRTACRAAVKANDIVHIPEMASILQQLQQCKQPFTCPHGRPTMIQFTIAELERKFKRVV